MDRQKLNIALVKQLVLPDLYVCPQNSKLKDILFSSIMRVGPIGLFYEFNCDFYIVEICNEKECQIWKEINQTPISGPVDLLFELKNKTLNQIPGQEFKEPGSIFPNGHFAIDVSAINWKKYDIVVSINIAIPTSIVKKNPDILWCYMLMEPNLRMEKVYFGYDVSFNHNISGIPFFRPGVIDFPYTFLHKNLLYETMKNELGRESFKSGIFCDISCSKETNEEKVILSAPKDFERLENPAHNLIIHKQNIRENLKNLFDSKYFVKIGGVNIRGNSIIEAISSRSLVLANPDLVSLNILISKECQVKTIEDARKLILYLDVNQDKYKELLYIQQTLLDFCVIRRPVESLYHMLAFKRKYGYYDNSLTAKMKKKLKDKFF